MNELSANGVQIYSFPIDDETVAEANKVMNVSEQQVTLPLNLHVVKSVWNYTCGFFSYFDRDMFLLLW